MNLFKEKFEAMQNLNDAIAEKSVIDQKVAEILSVYREEYKSNQNSTNSHALKADYDLLLKEQMQSQHKCSKCKMIDDNATERVKKEYLKIVNDHYDKNLKKNVIEALELLKLTEHEENEYLTTLCNKYGFAIENPRKVSYYRTIKLFKQMFAIK